MPSLPDIGSSLPEVALRTAIVYVFLVAAIRLTGKREVGQMSVLELVVILIISDAVQNSMVGENTSVWSGIVAVTVLLTLDIVLHALTGRSRRARRAIEGEPRLIVRDGRVLDKAMRQEAIDSDDVRNAIRAHGIDSVRDVRLAVIETEGSISVIPRERDAATGPG
jgi:uncharacterized membrane protein YcaP (DUF421 family)